MSFDLQNEYQITCPNSSFHIENTITNELNDSQSIPLEDCCWVNLIESISKIKKNLLEKSAKITKNDIDKDFNSFYFNIIEVMGIFYDFYRIIVKKDILLYISPIIYETEQDILLLLIKIGLISKQFVIYNQPLCFENFVNLLNEMTSYFDHNTNIIEKDTQSINKEFVNNCNNLIFKSRNLLFDLFICFCQHFHHDEMTEFKFNEEMFLMGIINIGYRNLGIFIIFANKIFL